MGEHFYALGDGDFGEVILAQQNNVPTNVVTIYIPPTNNPHILRETDTLYEKKESKPPSKDELVEKWEAPMFETNRVLKSYVVRDMCMDMDLSDDDTPYIINTCEEITKVEWEYGRDLLKENPKFLLGHTRI